MQLLHSELKQKHKLTNNGRMQYTLFLKDIGVSQDKCIQLMNKEYSKILKNNEVCIRIIITLTIINIMHDKS